MTVTLIGFDADDTLWHHEAWYRLTQDRFVELLADHAAPEDLNGRLLAAERRNLGHYGYGVKGFMLSMIETAVEITEGRVPGRVIAEIIDAGRAMLDHPIELTPHAREAVATLAARHRVVLITKGDLLDQERKLAQSGLGDLFHGVEIVSEKTPASYVAIFARQGAAPQAALMVGNSVKSDVLPVLETGGWGVHVPHDLVWDLDRAATPEGHPRYRRIADLEDLPGLVAGLEGHQPHLAPVDARPASDGVCGKVEQSNKTP